MGYLVVNFEDSITLMSAKEFEELKQSDDGLLGIVCDVVNIFNTSENTLYSINFDVKTNTSTLVETKHNSRYLVVNFEDDITFMSDDEFNELKESEGGLLDVVSDVVHIVDTKLNLIYCLDLDTEELKVTEVESY